MSPNKISKRPRHFGRGNFGRRAIFHNGIDKVREYTRDYTVANSQIFSGGNGFI